MISILKKSIYLCVALIFLLITYYTISSLSESKKFSKYTLDYLLLTPSLIKNQPIMDVYNENYYYSAADGNKPAVVAVTFFSKKNQEDIRLAITEYLKLHGYVNREPNFFRKEDREVSIKYRHSEDEDISVTLSIIEHIN